MLIHGAYIARRSLEAGVLDGLPISLVPALFGMPTSRIELEDVRAIDTPEAAHIRYRVRRQTDERNT